MSSTSTFYTFSELYTGILQAAKSQSSQAITVEIAKRCVNVALQDLHLGNEYVLPWTEREAKLQTHPPYSTGTVSCVQGTFTVTGTDTLWDSTNDYGQDNVRVGGKIRIAGTQNIHTVFTVGGAGTLLIASSNIDATVTDETYTYWEDAYALPADFHKPVDMRFFDDHREIELCDRKQLRRHAPNNDHLGRPRFATQIQLDPISTTALQPRLVLYPAPDAAYSIPYTYISNYLVASASGARQIAFVEDTDEPVMPIRYRHAIYYYALKLFYEHKDDARMQEANNMYNSIMQRILMDNNVGENRMRIEPQVGHYRLHAERPYSGSRRGRRFDTSSNSFDRLG